MATDATLFQRDCLRAAQAFLASREFSTDFQWVTGREECYYLQRVTPAIEVYIYEDEAGFFVNGDWHILESQDYPDSDALIRRFLEELARWLPAPQSAAENR